MSPSATTLVLNAIREGLVLVLLLSAPPLIASMVTGFVVGLFQAATQIQDQTLAFVPKLVVVLVVLVAMGPVLGSSLVRFTQAMLLAIPSLRLGLAMPPSGLLGIVVATALGGGARAAGDLAGGAAGRAAPAGAPCASASRCCWRWSPSPALVAAAGGERARRRCRRCASPCCSRARSSSACAWAWSRRRRFAPPRSPAVWATRCAGANVAEILVPTAEERASPLGVLYLLLATIVFLQIGGVPRLVEALCRSYADATRSRAAWASRAARRAALGGRGRVGEADRVRAGAGRAGRRRAVADRPRAGPDRARRALGSGVLPGPTSQRAAGDRRRSARAGIVTRGAGGRISELVQAARAGGRCALKR